jgi:NADP-dependent 3-hydroxy acid dehydrogenase YdfG
MPPSIPSPTQTFHTSPYPSISPTLPALSAANKTILVTGGGSGIGSSTAASFAQAGATKLIILGRSEQKLLDAKKDIESKYKHAEVTTFAADVVDEAAITSVAATVKQQFGHIDVLVNNAGYSATLSSIADANITDWWRTHEVNVLGALTILKAFLPLALAAPAATLINVSSAAAHIPYVPNLSSYSTSKTASTRLFEYVHHEHPGLRVFNTHPGLIMTELHEKNLKNGLVVRGEVNDVELSGNFMVWLASKESEFARGKLLWANWDVDELKAKAEAIQGSSKFTMVLEGWM